MQLSSSLSSIILLATSSVLAISNRDSEKCAACYGLANHVSSRLKDTEARANEQIAIGKRLNADGDEVPKTVISYGESERRLLDVLEGACQVNDKKAYCNELLHDEEDFISSWFHNARDNGFAKYVCDTRISGCNSDVAANARIEDLKKQEKFKVETPKSTSATAGNKKKASQEEAKSSTSTGGAPDLIELGRKLLNRMKNNMIRIRVLSVELFGEVQKIAEAKDWPKLQKMVMDRDFYSKYYIVFVAFFFAIYMIFSIFESIFFFFSCKKPAATRSSKSTKRTTNSSGASKSGKSKKDE